MKKVTNRSFDCSFSHNKFLEEKRNLILFSFGKLTSVFGSAIYTFAIGLYVLNQTGSGFSYAATLVFGLIPVILITPISGVMADRFDKKKIIVISDLLSGVLFISLYFITSWGYFGLPVIFASTFLSTSLTTLFAVSMESAKPGLVFEEKLLSINSTSKIIDSIAAILGPMAGGLVYAFVGIKFFILLNGISYFISALSEILMNFNLNRVSEKTSSTDDGFFKSIQEGFNYIRTHNNISGLFSIFILLNFFISLSVTVPLPYILTNILKLSSQRYGFVQGGFPVGMIFGALIVGKVMKTYEYNVLIRLMGILLSVEMLFVSVPLFVGNMLGETVIMVYYFVLMTMFGVAISLIDIPLFYIIQKEIHESIRGRVLSIGISLSKIISPIGLLISGLLIKFIHISFITMFGAICMFIISVSININKTKVDSQVHNSIL